MHNLGASLGSGCSKPSTNIAVGQRFTLSTNVSCRPYLSLDLGSWSLNFMALLPNSTACLSLKLKLRSDILKARMSYKD
jgi:hypothetical protein